MNSIILNESYRREESKTGVKSDVSENVVSFDLHKNLDNLIEHLPNDNVNSMGYNNQRLCRICLLSKNNLIQASLVIHKEISEMYFAVTSIKMSEANQANMQICELCNNDLVFCYNFKLKCQRSDMIFKSLSIEVEAKEEMNGCRTIEENKVKVESDVAEVSKEEEEEHEEIQYLEDINEFDYNIEDLELNVIQSKEQLIQNAPSFTLRDPKRISARKNHKVGKERKISHSCLLCSKKFLKMKTFKAHIMNEHGPENLPHSCKHCKKTFSSEHDLELHSTIHVLGDTWTCNKCHKKFQEKSRFRRHIQRHMETKRHTCIFCGKKFAELYALRRHERIHTGELPEKRYACHLCDKRYSSRTLLTAHMGQHSGIRPCVCQTCGKSFPSQRLLASHRLVHSDNKPHACLYCEKTFRHESTRNTHHRTHTGEKPYVCATCGKTFIQRSNLVLHMRTHTGERPYSCKMCERSFTSGSTLKNHMRTHTGDKPYSCPVCEKRFARIDMRAHMAQHTGERPHGCSVCNKRFASAWRLREHCRLHTGEKPFECAHCTDKFATKSQLMKHFKTHQKQRKLTPAKKRDVIILRQLGPAEKSTPSSELNEIERNSKADESPKSESTDAIVQAQDMPLEVTQEVVLQDEGDGEVKNELLMVDNGLNSEYRSTDDVKNVNDSKNDMNYIAVNEGGVSISSTAMLEGATVKLYQLDQSLVQIRRSGRQLTISKITSKMTANFQKYKNKL